MRAVVIAAAASLGAAGAFAFPAAPAAAQNGGWATTESGPGPGHRDPVPDDPHPDDPGPDHPAWDDGQWRDGRDFHDRRRHRRFHETVVVHGPSIFWDANRSFDPDRWNDWWHERPWRAYPRWVTSNQNCAPDRMWWGGGAWRCGW